MSIETETDPTVVISGVVQVLNANKPTFSAGRLYSGGRVVSFSVKGFVKVGEPVSIKGQWETHPRWGKQFKGTEVVYVMPADVDGMAAWFGASCAGLGPVRARKLVELFGTELPRMLAQSPEQVAIDAKLPMKVVEEAAEKWGEAEAMANLGSALFAYELTQHEVAKLIARYKGGAITIIEDNPYMILGDLPGFGWARVDAIGRKVGVPLDSPGRIKAAVITTVTKELDDGSTCISREGLTSAAGDLLGVTVKPSAIETALVKAVEDEDLVQFGDVGFSSLAAAKTEKYLWTRFKTGGNKNPLFRGLDDDDIDEIVNDCRAIQFRGKEVLLDDSQLEAVRLVAKNRFTTICGGAGSGKTTIIKAVCDLVKKNNPDAIIALCAPTGIAARRIQSVVDRTASTIHRLLGWGRARTVSGAPTFEYRDANPLSVDCVICDEQSMVSAELLEALIRGIGPNTMLVMLGDDNQLSPVGAGHPLRDILEHELVPFHKLMKCHRQAGPLKYNCVRILEGVVEPTVIDAGEPGPWLVHKMLETPEKVMAAVQKLFVELFDKWSYGDLMSNQFITAKHEGALGTKRLNELVQRLHQAKLGVTLPVRGPDEFLPLMTGDKVIHTKNNYKLDVMNGTVGIVIQDKPLIVKYEDREVEYPADARSEVMLAYCLSCHKTQGNQFPCAIVIVPKAHSFMQHRSWLYTAATRSQQTTIIIGDSDGIRLAAQKIDTTRRRTILEMFAQNPELQP